MPRYGAKSYVVEQASCKRLASVLRTSCRMRPRSLPTNLCRGRGRLFMEQLDRAAAVTRQLALRAHCGAEAWQGRGQDPVIGGDRAAAPAEIVDPADPGEIPLDDTKSRAPPARSTPPCGQTASATSRSMPRSVRTGIQLTPASRLKRSPTLRGVFQDCTRGRLDRAGNCLHAPCDRVGGFVCHQ